MNNKKKKDSRNFVSDRRVCISTLWAVVQPFNACRMAMKYQIVEYIAKHGTFYGGNPVRHNCERISYAFVLFCHI